MTNPTPERIAEYIPLVWEYERGYDVIRGHVTLEQANEALATEGRPAATTVRHAYARWGMNGACDHADRVIYTYDTPGRGRFQVTLAHETGVGL